VVGNLSTTRAPKLPPPKPNTSTCTQQAATTSSHLLPSHKPCATTLPSSSVSALTHAINSSTSHSNSVLLPPQYPHKSACRQHTTTSPLPLHSSTAFPLPFLLLHSSPPSTSSLCMFLSFSPITSNPHTPLFPLPDNPHPYACILPYPLQPAQPPSQKPDPCHHSTPTLHARPPLPSPPPSTPLTP